MVRGPFLFHFGRILRTLGPQKSSSRVGEVLFLRKSRFSDEMRFWMYFGTIFGGFGSHFGDHFVIKIASKNGPINQSVFGLIFQGFWLPIGIQFGSILAPKIDEKSRSIFDTIFKN